MGITEDVFGELSVELETVTESLQKTLGRLRTGRANASLLDGIRVDYYGSLTPLAQCAQINVPEPRLITVKPWEKPLLSAIEKAIMTSELGLNPQNDGEMIRLPVPQLTEERRKDLVKQAKGRGEEAKIGIRNHRRDANEMLKAAEKDKEISQDELKRALDKVQVIIDKGVTRVDELLGAKEQEILEL